MTFGNTVTKILKESHSVSQRKKHEDDPEDMYEEVNDTIIRRGERGM